MSVLTAPPRVITTDEYESDWKPKGWQLIIIGPTSTWRQDWGEWEAIRDIVQNALDECEYYSSGYDGEGFFIRDSGKGIAVGDFLLGPPKLKPDYARGKHGEGMKIAALALLRLGYSVRVETKDKVLWIIFLEQTVNGRIQTLAAMWKPNGRTSGTSFHIIGYRGNTFKDRFAVNLPRNSIISDAPSLLNQPIRRFNQLLQHWFPPIDSEFLESGEPTGSTHPGRSRIYARDIFMREINSPYSYNLWGFNMSPDRHGPIDEQDLWVDAGRLWSCVTKVEHLKVFLQMVQQPPMIESEESFHISMGTWEMGREPVTGKEYADFVKENASVWREAWHAVIGDNAVIRTDSRWDGMVKHLGYESVSVQSYVRGTLSRVITTDRDLISKSQERLREVEIVPEEQLEHRLRVHLTLAKRIAKKVFPYSPLTGIYIAVIPAASDRVRTAGMYSTSTGDVYISLDMMSKARSVIDTLIHELAHHRQFTIMGEAEDLTPSHAESMTYIAAEVVRIISSGEFDELFKEVVW